MYDTVKCTCKKCNEQYFDQHEDENYASGLCYNCFCDKVEEYEERRRDKISRDNEY